MWAIRYKRRKRDVWHDLFYTSECHDKQAMMNHAKRMWAGKTTNSLGLDQVQVVEYVEHNISWDSGAIVQGSVVEPAVQEAGG